MSTAVTKVNQRSEGVAVRHAQMCHPIKHGTPYQHLRGLSLKTARPDMRAEDRLEPKHLRLGQRAAMILTLPLPLRSADSSDAPQILISQQSFGLAVAVLPDARSLLWWDGCSRLARSDQEITIPAVIRSIRRHLAHLILKLIEQVGQDLRVFERVGRDHRRHNLARRFVGGEVEFAPSAPLRVPVLAHLPFSFAIDFHSRRIHHQMQCFGFRAAWQLNFQRLAPSRESRVIGHGQRNLEQLDDRREQPLSGAQRQIVNFRQSRHALNRRLGISARLSPLAARRWVLPRRDAVLVNPQGQSSAFDQSRVIFFPVTETVCAFRSFAFHTSRLPALLSP